MRAVVTEIDFDLVFELDEFRARFLHDANEANAFAAVEKNAREYLAEYGWFEAPLQTYVASYYPPIVTVFLYHVVEQEPYLSSEDDDVEWVWVVVGDLPSVFLVEERISDGLGALYGYTVLIDDWVETVEAGDSVEEYFFIDLPADRDNAGMLRIKSEFLKKNFILAEKPPLFPGIGHREI